MLGVKRGQVNESRGIGGGSRGLLVKNRDYTHHLIVDAIAYFRQLQRREPLAAHGCLITSCGSFPLPSYFCAHPA